MSHGDVLHTADPDEAVTRLSPVYCPYKLSSRGSVPFFCHHVTHGTGRVRVMEVTFRGEEVTLDPLPFEDFVLVSAPRTGSFSARSGAEGVTRISSGFLAMDAHRRRTLTWSDNASVLNVLFDRASFERTAAELQGIDAPAPIRFELQPPPARSAHQWRAVSRLLADYHSEFGGNLDHGLCEGELFRLAVATVLEAFPHHLARDAGGPAGGAAPRAVRRAQQYLELHADSEVQVEAVAADAGLTVRGLHAAFQRAGLPSPMRHLREIRVRRAHEELVAKSAEETTVTSVALRWGFTNSHRFAVLHRRLYGTSPRDALTLRR